MADMTWLSQQAQQIHGVFEGIFYVLVLTLFCIGILMEYFKWPLGGMPAFPSLVGRALVAAIMLHSLPEVMNAIADITDALTKQLGDFNQLLSVFHALSGKIKDFSWSWVSIKESITWVLSFLGFYLLYVSYFIAEAFVLYSWSLLYIFSPLLIALFVLPSTAGATKALYQSLIEVSCWKVVWAVLATLLWSTALSEINKPAQDINFITVMSYSLLLAGSVLGTPFIVHALAGAGMGSLAKTVGGIAVGGAMITPRKVAGKAATAGSKAIGAGKSVSRKVERNENKKLYRHTPTLKSKEPAKLNTDKPKEAGSDGKEPKK